MKGAKEGERDKNVATRQEAEPKRKFGQDVKQTL